MIAGLLLLKLAVPFLSGMLPLSIVAAALGVVLVLGAAKEWIYDTAHSDVHTVDKLDFAATMAGGLLVCLPAVMLLARW